MHYQDQENRECSTRLLRSLSPHIPPFNHARGCLLTSFHIHRNAIGSSHNVRLAKSPAAGWSVTSRLDTLYLSQGLNLYRRERHALLAGEADTPIISDIPPALTNHLFPHSSNLVGKTDERKRFVKASILCYSGTVVLTLRAHFLRMLQKCTAERPSCKLCKSTGTEKDCVYEPTWRVLSATDLESMSRRNSTTPVSCSEDGESSRADEYDCPPWTGDCPGDAVYQSRGSERKAMGAPLCQDRHSVAPNQGYPVSCENASIGEPKQDG